FSSRRRHTRFSRDWSSDVCSSDLRLPRSPRMDGAIVKEADGTLRVLEARYVRKGQPVAVGYAEDGSEGILVDAVGLDGGEGGSEIGRASCRGRGGMVEVGLEQPEK